MMWEAGGEEVVYGVRWDEGMEERRKEDGIEKGGKA